MYGRSPFINHLHSRHVPLFDMKMIQSFITLNQQSNRMRIPIDKHSQPAITFTCAMTFLLNATLECMQIAFHCCQRTLRMKACNNDMHWIIRKYREERIFLILS